MIPERDIALVRSFNRLVTRQVGALNDRYLGRRPLGEARVLFEIGHDGATPRDVRARLGLDSGYVSRMLGSLERDGLIERTPNPADRRSERLRLTPAGLSEVGELDRLSDDLASSVLAPLDEAQRARLLAAQAEVRRLLAISLVQIAPERVTSADARWCLGHYFAELDARFEHGFDVAGALAESRSDLGPPSGAFLVARVHGQPAGCGGLRTLSPGVAEIVRMWVDAAHRGLGIGRRLLEALETHAVALGLARVRLDTNRALDEAKAMYRGSGYVEIDRYSDNPYANHWFEKELGEHGGALDVRAEGGRDGIRDRPGA
jgi:DNA-binding MarR family transcriptional regulator/GNAT superfamily N-acetyltransferase